MEIREKLRNNNFIKKALVTAVSVVTVSTAAITAAKFADGTLPLKDSNKNDIQILADAEIERLPNTDTITYIYDAQDLSDFRDAVNAGDSYLGKTVYLMNDIDMSEICSAALGAWEPIGYNSPYFEGTFEGNFHTLSNLYVSTSNIAYIGLFSRTYTNSIVRNLIMNNPYVYNAYTAYSGTASIAGINHGTIECCASVGGSVTGYQTTTATAYKAVVVGGIVGYNQRGGVVQSCYNTSSISGTANTSNSNCQTRLGGVVGINNGATMNNCYNMGSVTGKAYTVQIGGVVGMSYNDSTTGKKAYVSNCYNTGTVTISSGTTKRAGGIVGGHGTSTSSMPGTVSNSYCLTNTTYSMNTYSSSGWKTSTANRVSVAVMKTYTAQLGNGYAHDVFNLNGGYPVLEWQNNRPILGLNKNQEYIKVGETLTLNVNEKDDVRDLVGNNFNTSNFVWKSTNESVATVNSNGKVVGVGEGTTTIYAYYEPSNVYAMAIVNVAKDFAMPQIETAYGYTVILKSDGTVWTTGNNEKGTLGVGNNVNYSYPVQVKIDEDTNLENIIKISVGSDHVLALAKNGNVYAWGANGYGQLGNNSVEGSKYARMVLDESGKNYLGNIVDISANTFGSIALDKDGYVYVWGNGTYGEIGNKAIVSTTLPVKNIKIKQAIRVTNGAGQSVILDSTGSVWAWGRNLSGRLGIGSAVNTNYPMRTALNVTEITTGFANTIITKVDGSILGTGANSNGRLTLGTATNTLVYVNINIPEAVTESNKIKSIKAGIQNTTLLLEDGTVWTVGNGLLGENGDGTGTIVTTGFVQAKTEKGFLSDVAFIGCNKGESDGDLRSLNTAAILKNGDVYVTGDNTYGQIGNYTYNSSLYFTKMEGKTVLLYREPIVELSTGEQYQIDKNKLYFDYQTFNVYTEEAYEISDLEFVTEDSKIASINNSGLITATDPSSAMTNITVKDIVNGFDAEVTVIVNKLENTKNNIYIYSVDDFIKFRDSVNEGNSYTGKNVYLMADLDLSSVCSPTLGTWEPIGYTLKYFGGVFDGNYHTISNLYIKLDDSAQVALFSRLTATGVIRNTIIDKPNIYSGYQNYSRVASLCAFNFGTIENCASINGTVVGYQTLTATSYKACVVGGLVSYSTSGLIANCYNSCDVYGTANTSNSNCQTRIGGVLGINNGSTVTNCYNSGTITGKAYVVWEGGVVGMSYRNADTSTKPILSNLYNYGVITATGGTTIRKGGITGTISTGATNSGATTISNSYCTTSSDYSYYSYSGGYNTNTAGRTAANTLKTYASKLGGAFENDDFNINNGYPILYWQAPTLGLTKKQEYIKAGTTLQLNVLLNENSENILGKKVSELSLVWTSSNEDIATVDSRGLVTGIKDGYTTIYVKDEDSNIYGMTIVNVYANKANPQVETGDGFTVILKSDGTVWALGNNDEGQLGDGTTENKIEAVRVKISANKYLENVIKISVGGNHTLALTSSGIIYAWGLNSNGQLGLGNSDNSLYAKQVVGEKGEGYLDKIVDISAGSYGSIAVNEFGWVYIWGNGSYGEVILNTESINSYPIRTSITSGISAQAGSGYMVALTQSGNLEGWGRNNYGQLGNNTTTDVKIVSRIATKVIDVTTNGYHTIYRNINDDLYAAGWNTKGQLAIGTVKNSLIFVKMTMPTNETSKIKYIKAGKTTSTILMQNGKVYSAGTNTEGALGAELDETTTYSNKFVQAKLVNSMTGEVTVLGNIEYIGRSNGEKTTLNIVGINNEGRIVTSGSNSFGQIGNNTYNSSKCFTQMGYTIVNYPYEILVSKDSTYTLEEEDLLYKNMYLNVYKDDIVKISLIDKAVIENPGVALYGNGTIYGEDIGETVLVTVEEISNTVINIPVRVVEDNKIVTPDVQTGNRFTIALKSDGTIWSFGYNVNGELGLGNLENKNNPNKIYVMPVVDENSGDDLIIAEEKVKQISVGNNHTIILTTTGKIYTWGLNNYGQLGTGNKVAYYNNPVYINIEIDDALSPVKEKFIKVIANKNTTYAITQTGNVYAWGEGYKNKPKLLELEDKVTNITTNYYLTIDGVVKKLLDGKEIKLSYNEYEQTSEPEVVNERVAQISEGTDHLLLLGESGNVFSYGKNTYGQLGDMTTIERNQNISTVVRKSNGSKIEDIYAISAGDGYSLVLSKTKELYCFGKNEYGELGVNPDVSLGGTQDRFYADKVNTIDDILDIDAGMTNISLYNGVGNVYTFGSGIYGELGNCDNSNYYVPQKVGKSIIESNTNEIVIHETETFEIESIIRYFNLFDDIIANLTYDSLDGNVAQVNNNGIVEGKKEGRTTIIVREVDTDKMGIISIVVLASDCIPKGQAIRIEPQVATAGTHTITLRIDGTVWGYGQNEYGELGNGTTIYSDEPVKAIFPEGTVIVKIATGEEHSLALDSDGNVWTWGRNRYYQLGNSSDEFISKPKKIKELIKIKDIECGTFNSFAIKEDGTLCSWGLNANGECGIGSYTSKITISDVKNLNDVIDVKAGKNHTIVLKSTGEVYVSGSNLYGELGNNDDSIRKTNTFIKVENLQNIVQITSGLSNNIALDILGDVYVWGSNLYGELGVGSTEISSNIPLKLSNVTDIRYLNAGKNTAALIDVNGNVFVSGNNKLGGLGTGSNSDILTFKKINTIENVFGISQGTNYTVYLKDDGTVFGNGDYNQVDSTLISKTCSFTPIRVGNDEVGFKDLELLVHEDESINLTNYFIGSFNLKYIDENEYNHIVFESVNSDIATVSSGVVTGIKTGTTRVKARNTKTSKMYSMKINVIEAEYITSPIIDAGENFAVVLAAEGSINTFGYNGKGALANGNYITQDVPVKTNILATYKDISVGKDFFIALRNDDTVWAAGNNNYGQVGSTNNRFQNYLFQINGLSEIKKIAAGEDFAIALSKYGIVYGWGRNNYGQLGNNRLAENIYEPMILPIINETIVDIAAGNHQTVFITVGGKIYGMGNILNGYLEELDNICEVEVGENYLVLLTANGKVYTYDGTLNSVSSSNVIDISVKNNLNMYKSSNEKAYEWDMSKNESPTVISEHNEDIYEIGCGYNNTYIINNLGYVYAKGDNTYGQLGNSTRNSSSEYTLVGNRDFEIIPATKLMIVNDVEQPEIVSDTFNVFEQRTKDANEYLWSSDDDTIVEVLNGELTAKAVGTSVITITDKVTNVEKQIERYVQPIDKQRIDYIKVNSSEAYVNGFDPDDVEIMTYKVKVETDEIKEVLTVKTKDPDDIISLNKDDFENGVGTGILSVNVRLVEKETIIPIYIKIANGTVLTYNLTVEKISKNVGIKEITATEGTNYLIPDSIVSAKAVTLNAYEVIVSESTQKTAIKVVANSEYASISIDGKEYELGQQENIIEIGTSSPRIVNIVLKAENGKEQEYLLRIYKQSVIGRLESVAVDGKEAVKVSDDRYVITVDSSISKVIVHAKTVSNLVKVSIAKDPFSVHEDIRQVELKNNPHNVNIEVQLPDGNIKEITLEIYKKSDDKPDDPEDPENPEYNLDLDMVIVNGKFVVAKSDGTYLVFMPSAVDNVNVHVIAYDITNHVQINGGSLDLGESEIDLNIPNAVNIFTIKVKDDEEHEKYYSLIIKKVEADTSLQTIKVTYGKNTKEATKKDANTYEIRIPSNQKTVNVTAITEYVNSNIKVDDGDYVTNIASKDIEIEVTKEVTKVTITIKSEDGQNEEEYILNIIKMSKDASLESVYVNDIEAIWNEQSNAYKVQLVDQVFATQVKATTTDKLAKVKIEENAFENNITIRTVKLSSKETVVPITVKSEDGSIVKYNLVISGLPDNTNIDKVVVNGVSAVYKDGQNLYEVRLQASTYNIEVMAQDILAKVKLANEEEKIGSSTTIVSKTDNDTIVKVKITAQNGIDEEEYTILITEKSSDASISVVSVNGKTASQDASENYTVEISENDVNAVISLQAHDSFAIISLDSDTDNSDKLVVTKSTVEQSYTIKVVAEDGTINQKILTIKLLSANKAFGEISVTTVEDIVNEETSQTTQKTQVQNIIYSGNNVYTLKIPRVNKATIKINVDNVSSSVKIKNSTHKLSENTEEIDTTAEKTVIPFEIKAEDGSTKTYELVLEKLSNNTGITVSSLNCIRIDNLDMYVDEVLNSIDININANNSNAKLRLNGESDYNNLSITRTISLDDESKTQDEEGNTCWKVIVEVEAENGETKEHTVFIYKIGNTVLDYVKINNQVIIEKDSEYKTRVNVANTVEVSLKSNNENATIEILEEIIEEGSISYNTISSGTGVLNSIINLNSNPQNYIIRVTSAKGNTIKEYALIIEQKSQEAGISYIKVNELNAIEDSGTYISIVAGKEKYPLVIKAKDENAKIKICYGLNEIDEGSSTYSYISNWQKGKFIEYVPVPDGEKIEVLIIVQAEDGNESTYTLEITRVSSNTNIERITVEDLVQVDQGDGTFVLELIPVEVLNYNSKTNTYSIIINKDVSISQVVITAESELSKVKLDNNEEVVHEASLSKSLPGKGKTRMKMTITAADGSIKDSFLEILQLSSEIGIDVVKVDDQVVTQDSIGNYEITISDNKDLTSIYVKLIDVTSKVSINSNADKLLENTYNFNRENVRQFIIPIKVTSEDGTEIIYSLTINVVSANKEIESISVDDQDVELVLSDPITYIAYINDSATTAKVEIVASSQYANIEQIEIVSGGVINVINSVSQSLTFNQNIENDNTYIYFRIRAEDGTVSDVNSLNIQKKSTDCSLSVVSVNKQELDENDLTYHTTISADDKKALVEVTSSSKYAKVEIIESEESITEGIGKASKQVNIDSESKVTVVTIRITSQNGEFNTYTLNIERIYNDYSIDFVKVNYMEAELRENKTNEYVSYIYDTIDNVKISIKAKNEYAKIEQVVIENENITVIRSNVSELVFNYDTLDEMTKVYFRIIAENDELISEVYELSIEKRSTDTTLKEIYVNNKLITPDAEGKYKTTILDSASDPVVKAVTNNEFAHLRIGLDQETLQVAEKTVILSKEKETIVPITVRSHSGLTDVTNLYIEKIATDGGLDLVTVDEKECNIYNENKKEYEFIVDKNQTRYELSVTTLSQYSNIKYNNVDYGSSLKMFIDMPEGLEGKSITLKVSSEAGKVTDYTITLIRKSSDIGLTYLKVDGNVATPLGDGITYNVMIGKLQDVSKVEVKTNLQYANIRIGDAKIIKSRAIEDINCVLNQDRILVPIVVTAPDGVTVETYNLILTRGSNNTTITEIKVDENEPEAIEDGIYYFTTSVKNKVIKIYVKAEDPAASIAIGNGGNEVSESTVNYNLTNGQKLENIELIITAQDGTTEVKTIQIKKLSDEIGIGTVKVNDKNVTLNYDEATKSYQAAVTPDVEIANIEVALIDDEAKVSIDGNGAEKKNSSARVDLLEDEVMIELKITAEDGSTDSKYIYIIKQSQDNSIELVKVNDEEVEDPYVVGIKQLDTSVKLYVKAMDNNAKVKIDNNTESLGSSTVTLNIPATQQKITVKVVITAQDGIAKSEKTITLVRLSNDTSIALLKVNGQEIEISDNMTAKIKEEENSEIKVVLTDKKASVGIDNGEQLKAEITETVETKSEKNVKIKVTSEDGTQKEYTLTIKKKSTISGRLNTKNATISVYLTSDLTKPRKVVEETKSGEDGIFTLYVDAGIYDIAIIKDGFLPYTLTNVDNSLENSVDLEDITLDAGEIVKDDVIDVDDLVYLNKYLGMIITDDNKEEYGLFDLNEDGVVDKLDRNILKSNYGKKAKTEVWVAPVTMSLFSLRSIQGPTLNYQFIKPVGCEYEITSQFGERVHPITGEISNHSGIDICGEHNTKILAVADGIVTFAGVQDGYGNCIEIKHEIDGEIIYTFYAHMSRLDVEMGSLLSQGDIIGLEGGDPESDPNPGTSTGHHLHFEVRLTSCIDGTSERINPMDVIEF